MTDPTFPPVDLAAWRSQVEAELGGADFEAALTTELLEGIRVQPLYTSHGAANRQPRSYIGNALGWFLTPRIETTDTEDAQRQIARDLAGGATALWLRLDQAARSGIEADGRAEGTLAGRDGVAAYHAGDLQAVLVDVPLDEVALSLDAGANTLPAAAALIAFMQGRNIDPGAAELHFNCDPVAALAQDGTLPTTTTSLAAEMAQLTRFCEASARQATAITVSDLPFHAAGATVVDELGIAAATLATYLRWLEGAGCDPETVMPYILLRSAVDRDLFTGIAKLRALRTLWNKIASACGVTAVPAARIHAVTADRPLTQRAPWLNMLRATGQTLAAVTGGADFITTAAWDRPLGRSTDDARRLARNTQTILGEESSLGKVLDPAGGSHYVEELTDQLARKAWTFFQEIERQGGCAVALATGWLPERLEVSRAAREAAVGDGRLSITGVTDYVAEDEDRPERELFDAEFAADHALDRLRQHRDQRLEAPDPDRDCTDLSELIRLAGTGATLGELSRALRRRPADPIEPLPSFRDEEAAE